MRYCIMLLCLLWALPVFADEPSRVRYKLPVVETNSQGQKCLNTQEWKEVIAVASEYKKHFDWRLDIEPVLLDYVSLDRTYGLLNTSMEESIARLEDSRDDLKLQLSESESLRLKLQRSHTIEKGVMWAVILVETVVIGIVGARGLVPLRD